MNNTRRNLLLLLTPIMLLALVACDTSVKTDKAEIGDPVAPTETVPAPEIYVIDTVNSSVTWIGSKITGRHNGVFKISQGELHMHNNQLTGGTINFDMRGTRASDRNIDESSNARLTMHLRSPDFFDVARYPAASFVLTGVAPYDSTRHKVTTPDSELRIKGATHYLTGNLTIKDKTRSVRFPAKITLHHNKLKAQANFNIDRTAWGLVYRSDEALGNQTIYPEVNIGIDLVAKHATP
ncbi:MAG TPA: YceI family protein [Pontibacter sp.]